MVTRFNNKNFNGNKDICISNNFLRISMEFLNFNMIFNFFNVKCRTPTMKMLNF